MGIYRYIKMTFLDDIKKSLFYMIVLILSIVMIFNIFNIVLNQGVVSSRSDEYTSISALGFIILGVSTMFIFFANSYYLEDKYKEYAIISTSGRSIIDICKIIIIRSSVVTILSVSIGCVIGVISSSTIMNIVCNVVGVTTEINNISRDAVIITVLLMFTELEVVFITNTGGIYRSNINELVNKKKKAYIKDKRKIRVNPIFYVLLYLLPVIVGILPMQAEDKIQLVKLSIIIGLLGIQGLVRYVIPDYISSKRKKNIVADKYKLIELSNLYTSLQKSTVLMLVFVISIILAITIGGGYKVGSLINTMSLICYGLIVLIMSFTVVYKFLIEAKSRKESFMQLKLLGYTNAEIKKIIFNEVIMYYLIIMLLSFIYISMILINNILAGLMTVKIGILLILAYLIIFMLTEVLSYRGYKKVVL